MRRRTRLCPIRHYRCLCLQRYGGGTGDSEEQKSFALRNVDDSCVPTQLRVN